MQHQSATWHLKNRATLIGLFFSPLKYKCWKLSTKYAQSKHILFTNTSQITLLVNLYPLEGKDRSGTLGHALLLTASPPQPHSLRQQGATLLGGIFS